MIYDRAGKRVVDSVDYGGAQTRFLYTSPWGRALLRLVSSKAFSRLNALYNNTGLSSRKIPKVEEAYAIDPSEYDGKAFRSFNDFFTRRLDAAARPFSDKPTDFIAPADSKATYKHISPDLLITVKGGRYSMGGILEDQGLAQEYSDGTCLIFRLSVDDCHRYVFPDDGAMLWSKAIDGVLHTVQPIAHLSSRPYLSNYRIVSRLRTAHFGDILFIEIGALLVGRINDYRKEAFHKGEEKGFFELGGSTIVILLKPHEVRVDDDIVGYSGQDIETKVRQGETIGVKHA